MTGILAIETATEACSVALWRDGDIEHRYELAARQHNQRIFAMLQDLMPAGLDGVDAIAYGSGPGSFTGLRIAASAVQGLAYAADLPALPVSTLACQVHTALRLGLVSEGDYVFSSLDARIREIYFALYRIENGVAVEVQAARGDAPAKIVQASMPEAMIGLGSGCNFIEQFPDRVSSALTQVHPNLLPEARDLLPLAQKALAAGDVQRALDVQPVYVRDEVNWKKLPDQGKAQGKKS
ncbi:tRNA (adenosine(37)-N6)-threonylcarbamoyltransferase complex dimerization subunit type 1 TsaB [Halioglobus maricola]|uniref:tRNA threonylcarbamoyladenosine biosynthesis protein TsaB n=1 Tax=Halioglobus maricola TaxID=2601894 RepID=A0A5P9NLX0_9GAMM|nr:tRNA (adenosine(37)-N6)-threonylcarbamoyltransferase complex dimerization subunit type 1 TsaB [Halioglobus maricola]QFU76506.1 tRNA (adenosine(37)-N6)-threonylcarbamoyltransferase complex dimerization subunit type 1 TsaB [Halioglobus maricola]